MVCVPAAFVLDNWVALAVVWGVLLILLCVNKLIAGYARFALVVLTPLAVMLSLMWGLVTQAPPDAPLGSDPSGGVMFAAVITLRVAVAAGILQLCLLSIPSHLLPSTLRGWGLRGTNLIAGLGAYAVLPEMALRMDQVVTAYRARGLLPGGRWGAISRLHRLLRPLFVWSIRAAVQRADLWQQRALLLRAEQLGNGSHEWSRTHGAFVVTAAVFFVIGASLLRWRGAIW